MEAGRIRTKARSSRSSTVLAIRWLHLQVANRGCPKVSACQSHGLHKTKPCWGTGKLCFSALTTTVRCYSPAISITEPLACGDNPYTSWLFPLPGMPAETTAAICSMIMGGVFEKFPKLKVCFAHGGKTLSVLVSLGCQNKIRPQSGQLKPQKCVFSELWISRIKVPAGLVFGETLPGLQKAALLCPHQSFSVCVHRKREREFRCVVPFLWGPVQAYDLI